MSIWLDTQTPQLTANDSRGMPVRQIAYWREDLGKPEARVTLAQHDVAGRLVAQRDPRLMADAAAPANLVSIYSLSGKVLSTVSVDAGWRVGLFGEADQAVLGRDGRGSQRRTEYDDQVRPVVVFELAVDGEFLCSERLAYGGNDPVFSARNQCGKLIRHDDAAGAQLFEQFGLAGEVLQQARHFLQTLESPDWPAPVSERDTLLEPGAGFTGRARFNPLGEAIEQTDAKGHRQFSIHTLAGQLREVRLQLAKDVTPKVLVSAIQYNAHGQTEREIAGNGVITLLEYAAQDGRLTHLQARRGSEALQDLRYAYDPVGNVLSIEDAALPIRYFANQQVEPINRYVYDSLYQLIKATGWEAGGSNQGPTFPRFDDPASCANYSQTYRYDRGGNLLELTHDGPQSHGHRLVAAAQSNRCLPVLNGLEPSEEDFRKSFDANGNLLNLQPGQVLRWDLRNQLREVSPVANDRERYVYGADGMRVRKVRSVQTNARTLISEVRYLPGLELRTHSGTGEALQVITVQAGRSSVRVLHWESEPPKDISNDQYRYNLNDHLGSCALELDSSGDIISQERYHPFGTTAWFAGRGEVEASYKTVRYSGQERDATGLYYYGFRYYLPWLQRWLNPDPAGYIDDLNMYKMVRNNPIAMVDHQGLQPEYVDHGHVWARDKWDKAIADRWPVRVRTIAPGMIYVSIAAPEKTLASMGINLERQALTLRKIDYLSIDSSYQSKLAGKDSLLPLKAMTPSDIHAATGTGNSQNIAFINGAFFNMLNRVSASAPEHATIGKSIIDGRHMPELPIPRAYADKYTSVTMSDGSMFHSAPQLSGSGRQLFTTDELLEPRFKFDPDDNLPGNLGHAGDPNSRSAISFAGTGSTNPRTRLILGRVPGGKEYDVAGYTLTEWAHVTNRLDSLNSVPGRSVNLDGGASTVLGAINRDRGFMADVKTARDLQRGMANFLVFYK
ncbi:RHS repeat-associated core domain-containing protein [Pseudomonas sp. P1.31]|jgi:insecticidal toxin complex protein TccC|uniref:RHS repeat-associated core domain-containing protein n=1 Tax=Pseudomonas sp. P1.31 TaxID=1699311 RepID=UPI0009E8D682|nr:RHS repeat-associated core domain-containing protein [Pseudomonas sp. P1.31]